jgi:UDP:flavonoid glycosyltransferase YjiC (YdhE family)
MRFLFSFIGGNGHFEPLVPLARAAVTMGHTVAFACGPAMVPVVERASFTVFPLGAGSAETPERLPLRPLDQDREEAEFRDLFAYQGALDRVPLISEVCATWSPDVVICDEADFGAMLAAERVGLPYASVLVMIEGSFVRPAFISGALNDVRAAYNLPPDQELKMLDRYLVLSHVPSSFRNPASPLPSTAHLFRPPLPASAHTQRPAWATSIADAPAIYFTLGTVFNTESGDLFARVIEGLQALSANVLITVGRHIDPAEFGTQPANITIERYIPQHQILPYCDLVISHGGSGSLLGSLSHGLPTLLLPLGADQFLNATRCAQLGLGRWLDPLVATPAHVHDAVQLLLSDPSYRQAARQMQQEIQHLPEVELAIRQLERIGTL